MGKREALRHDDWKPDPLNPSIPFRMSDRLTIAGLELKVNLMLGLISVVAALIGAGMYLSFR